MRSNQVKFLQVGSAHKYRAMKVIKHAGGNSRIMKHANNYFTLMQHFAHDMLYVLVQWAMTGQDSMNMQHNIQPSTYDRTQRK